MNFSEHERNSLHPKNFVSNHVRIYTLVYFR